jgi:hypothetical protein
MGLVLTGHEQGFLIGHLPPTVNAKQLVCIPPEVMWFEFFSSVFFHARGLFDFVNGELANSRKTVLVQLLLGILR